MRQWQFQKQGVKLLNVANITTSGTIDLDKTERYLSVEEVESKYKHFLVDEGDLVIASSGISFDSDGFLRTRGAFVQKEHLPLCMNTSTIRFKSKEDFSDLRFLKYWLDSAEFRTQISRFVTGSAQQNFGPSHLKEISISLPPLPEQRRIAALLDKADRLRRTRRYAAQFSDRFLRAVFVRMFGGPITNPKKWKKKNLGGLVGKEKFAVVDGPFGSHLKADEYTAEGVRVIRVNNIKPNAFNFDDVRYVSQEKYESIKRSTVRPGDVVMAKVGNTIGKACVFPHSIEYAVLTANVCKITLDSAIAVPLFICHQINFDGMQEQIRNLSGDTAKPMINIPKLRELEFIAPPLALQQEFARIVQQFERLRAQQQEAERQVEHLFQTLLHRAFSGEV